MAKIKLAEGGFTPIPEGEHIFKITKSTYDDDFGKLEVELVTANGQKHTERFGLINNEGEINEGAQKAFSYFAKTALNDFDLDEIDSDDIVGHYIKAVVEHDIQPNKNKPDKTVTFIRLGEKSPADGFAQNEKKVTTDTKTTGKKGTVDLDKLLG